jgi:hypothetical protein
MSHMHFLSVVWSCVLLGKPLGKPGVAVSRDSGGVEKGTVTLTYVRAVSLTLRRPPPSLQS